MDQATEAQRVKSFMESDYRPNPQVDATLRIAAAVEYIAYQLGQINRKLDKISAGSGATNADQREQIGMLDQM